MDQQPEIPAYQPPAGQTAQAPAPSDSNNKRRLLATWLLAGPTALIIASILLYAIINAILSSVGGEGGSAISAVINVILFIVGVVSVITWLPGIIAGIILLATQKKA